MFFGKCPGNCHTKGTKKVIGLGIHPGESSICRSAIYDGSLPWYGGVIAIGIQPGLADYRKGPELW